MKAIFIVNKLSSEETSLFINEMMDKPEFLTCKKAIQLRKITMLSKDCKKVIISELNRIGLIPENDEEMLDIIDALYLKANALDM